MGKKEQERRVTANGGERFGFGLAFVFKIFINFS